MEENNMDSENKKHLEDISLDVALKFFKIYFGMAAISFLSYVYGIFLGSFDFGLIVEAFSFFMIVFAYDQAKNKEFSKAKSLCMIGFIPLVILYLIDLVQIVLIEQDLMVLFLFLESQEFDFNVFYPGLTSIVIPLITVFSVVRAYMALTTASDPVETNDFNTDFYNKL